MSAGSSRARPEFYVPNGKPKCLWLRELRPGARKLATASALLPEHEAGLVDVTSGKMPLSQPQRRNLMEALRKARGLFMKPPATGSSTSCSRAWPPLPLPTSLTGWPSEQHGCLLRHSRDGSRERWLPGKKERAAALNNGMMFDHHNLNESRLSESVDKRSFS